MMKKDFLPQMNADVEGNEKKMAMLGNSIENCSTSL